MFLVTLKKSYLRMSFMFEDIEDAGKFIENVLRNYVADKEGGIEVSIDLAVKKEEL